MCVNGLGTEWMVWVEKTEIIIPTIMPTHTSFHTRVHLPPPATNEDKQTEKSNRMTDPPGPRTPDEMENS